MPWLKSEGKAPRNDKLWELSDAAYRLYDAGRHYAVENLTDGHVPLSRVSALTPKPATKVVIRELLKVRGRAPLWHELPEICDGCRAQRVKHRAEVLPRTGYVVHDFLEYNPSKTEYEEDQKRRRAAGRAGASARWGDASSHSETHGEPHAPSHGEPHGGSHSETHGERAESHSGVLSGTHAPYPVPRETDRSVPLARAQAVDPEPVDDPDEPAPPVRPRGTGSVDPGVRRGAHGGGRLRHIGEALGEGGGA
jgi:hypothetical protein